MIRFEHTQVVGWEPAIRGMRNPKNSWDKSDSLFFDNSEGDICHIGENLDDGCPGLIDIGDEDHKLMMNLAKAGRDHSKYRRMIVVYVDITAPLYWWKEFDTYKVGTVANSCSTMHKIHEKEFEEGDFSYERLSDEALMDVWDSDGIVDTVSPASLMSDVILMLNLCREKYLETKDKAYWNSMIQLLPSSYNQRRTIKFNYEVLANIYKSRRNHKLDEWSVGFMDWIKSLPYSELIICSAEKEEAPKRSLHEQWCDILEVMKDLTHKEREAMLNDLVECINCLWDEEWKNTSESAGEGNG